MQDQHLKHILILMFLNTFWRGLISMMLNVDYHLKILNLNSPHTLGYLGKKQVTAKGVLTNAMLFLIQTKY